MTPALFDALLAAASALAVLGAGWRFATWFRRDVRPDARDLAPLRRARMVLAGTLATIAGRRGPSIVASVLRDAVLPRRLLAQSKLRAFAHLLVMAGFTLLMLMHALAPLVLVPWVPAYQPTVEPWLFLRNLFGAMALSGLLLLVLARWRGRTSASAGRGPRAWAFATLLGVVLVTGFLLEAHKIASPDAFHRMTDQYAAAATPQELASLRALWARDYGVVFDDLHTVAAVTDDAGARLNEQACAFCHDRPVSAFVSWPLAWWTAPLTRSLDAAGAAAWLLHLHVLACFAGLALLPFTSFFHVLAAPASLLLDAVDRNRAGREPPLARGVQATRRALALDACVRCGLCDRTCSVAPLARHLRNPGLLPSHKLVATAAMASGALPAVDRPGDRFRSDALRAAEGAFLCTDCGRCTRACPVGLDLADLWDAGRRDLSAAGLAGPTTWVRSRSPVAWAEALAREAELQAFPRAEVDFVPLAADRGAFSRCVQCQTCTNVCPVVAHGAAGDPRLDLTPQKVMNLLRLGLTDLALGSRMVWDCATCYQCQEHCPEGIRVADIICELRSLAVQRLGAVRTPGAPT